MKKKGNLAYFNKKTRDIIHWVGFGIVVVVMTCISAYGFLLSLRPHVTFQSAPSVPLSLVGVALGNNIGSDTYRMSPAFSQLVTDTHNIQKSLSVNVFQEGNFFDEHFQHIDHMNELMKRDIVTELEQSENRGDTLKSYIFELETALETAEERMTSIRENLGVHMPLMEGLQGDIKATQSHIEFLYGSRDGAGIFADLLKLADLRTKEQEHKNIVVFSRLLEREYLPLLSSINARLTVLNANIVPLSEGIAVTLPANTKIDALKSLKIFTTP